jgi:EpsI family protein
MITRTFWAPAVSFILIAQTAVYYGLSRAELVVVPPAWDEFPTQIEKWRASDEFNLDADTLARLQPDAYVSRSYRSGNGNDSASLFIGYFHTRRTGNAPHSPQACLPGNGWEPQLADIVKLKVPDQAREISVNRFLVQKERMRLVVLYWYHQNGVVYTDEILAQLYAVPNIILHRRTDITFVRVAIPVAGDDSTALRTAMQFAVPVYSHVQRLTQ